MNEGTGQRLRHTYQLTNDIGGKTGTTQNQSDGWFIGYTPTLVAGSWVGGEYPQIHFNSLSLGSGSNMALPIWGNFYQSAVKDNAFRSWENAAFPPVSDSIRMVLNCERWLERRPTIIENLQPQELWDDILGIFRKNKRDSVQADAGTVITKKRRNTKTTTTRSERSKEIERKNKRLEKKRRRKKKSKKIWDKVFKRGN